MDMNTLRQNARENMKGFCAVCPVCNGKACAGKVPGMGGPITGAAFTANHEALQNTRINLSAVHDCLEPDTGLTMFGVKLAAPIMNGPMASPNINCGPHDDLGFQMELSEGVTGAGNLYWAGDPGRKEEVMNGCAAIKAAGRGVFISKPHVELDKVRARFDWGREAGAIAFGTDVDGAGILALRKIGYPVGPKTAEQIKELRAHMPDMPFIVKGIMTVDDARRCADAGVSHIVVSNHGGRVLDGTPGVAEVLPAIHKAVGGRLTILADGGVRSGVDVLKYLALGAKAVLVGRPLCWGAYGGGAEGVRLIMDTYADQLRHAMILTGCKSLEDISERVLYRKE